MFITPAKINGFKHIFPIFDTLEKTLLKICQIQFVVSALHFIQNGAHLCYKLSKIFVQFNIRKN